MPPASGSNRPSPTKATIKNLATNKVITCQFNPEQYSENRKVDWTKQEQSGQDFPAVTFKSITPGELKLTLEFDTTDTGEDVRTKYINDLWDLTKTNSSTKNSSGQAQPPFCQINWGSQWGWKAVVTDMTQELTLFLSDGTPVRAKVTMSLLQVVNPDDVPRQNPTSGGASGLKTYVIHQGQTLDQIANEEYNDPNEWRWIADYNDIEDPRRLPNGLMLSLPPHRG